MSLPDNYECEGQMSIFDLVDQPFKVTKPIRLIELFAGVGSQAMALRDIGANFEHYKAIEFDKYAIASYNAIHGTNFPTMDVTEIHGSDLGIVEKEKYTYMLTYSFPCTDLSVAGKMLGMEEGSGTRSALLWEVKRLLDECKELPQILVMENVPQVHSKANMPHFQKWLDYLTDRGYKTYWKDLNAKDFGVAQSRNRTIAISLLGNYTYKFPETFPLTKRMKDYLEEEVDEKYYLTNEKARDLIDKLIVGGKIEGGCKTMHFENLGTTNKDLTPSAKDTDVCQTLCARDYKGWQNYGASGVIECSPIRYGNIYGRDRGTSFAGNVYDDKGVCPTINTCGGGNREPLIMKVDFVDTVKVRKYEVDTKRLASLLIEAKKSKGYTNRQVAEYMGIPLTQAEHYFRSDNCFAIPEPSSWKKLKDYLGIETDEFDLPITEFIERDGVFEKGQRVYMDQGIAPTLTTADGEKIINVKKIGGVLGNHQAGTVYDKEGLSPALIAGMSHGNNMPYIVAIDEQNQAVREETFGTLTTDGSSPKHNNRVCEVVHVRQATKGGTIPCEIGGVADLNYVGSTTRRGRVQGNGQICPTLATENTPNVLEPWLWEIDGVIYLIRIRKLTPRECWRLMDFTDEDFDKAQSVNSNTQLYKQAGNSIVKNVLCEVFKQLF